MSDGIVLAPLVPWPLIAVLGAVALVLLAVAVVRGGRGWILRTLALVVLAVSLLNPRIIREQQKPQPDLAVIVVDESPSQKIGGRRAQTEEALAALRAALPESETLEVRVVRAGGEAGGEGGVRGTRLFAALHRALADEANERLAGAVLVTDGQVHDVPTVEDGTPLSVPVHVLLTGDPDERDRRLIVEQAPAYGLVGKGFEIVYKVEDTVAVRTAAKDRRAIVRFRVNGVAAGAVEAVVGSPQRQSFVLEHAGPTVVELAVEAASGEVSELNNRAAVVVNGIRDRLRVLLVSGQPHVGERTWRNLLKSDPSVDLVHFTILRPPDKNEMTPLKELSLIVFPVQELFQNKLYDFDLIIFDRYVVRGVLPRMYLGRIADYLKDGGALLLAVGPEFAGPRSLYRTPLGEIMPGLPTGRIVEQAFRPEVTELGRRHPVTSGLPGEAVSGAADEGDDAKGPTWGRWFRLVETDVRGGNVLMSGPGGRPLLIVERVGKGRIAQVLSDQIWLWARGFEGGGPHAELLRRLAHWLMKEPELEEENLAVSVEDGRVLIERRSLGLEDSEVTVTSPSGATQTLVLEAGADGVARAEVPATEFGLYRVEDDARTALAVAGTGRPLEFVDLRANAEPLEAVAKATGGGIVWLAEGVPDFRRTGVGRDTAGRGWMGLRRNRSYVVTGLAEIPLLPGLIMLALVLGGLAGAWWRESQ
jgi:hypothetical protein